MVSKSKQASSGGVVVGGDNAGGVVTGRVKGDVTGAGAESIAGDSDSENRPAWERWLKIAATVFSIIGVLVAIWIAVT